MYNKEVIDDPSPSSPPSYEAAVGEIDDHGHINELLNNGKDQDREAQKHKHELTHLSPHHIDEDVDTVEIGDEINGEIDDDNVDEIDEIEINDDDDDEDDDEDDDDDDDDVNNEGNDDGNDGVKGTDMDLVPLDKQRAIISDLLQKQSTFTEGALLNVIPQDWFAKFRDEEFSDSFKAKIQLGPIDTKGLIDENGIFADCSRFPYIAISPEIFENLVSWYGLSINSKPITTYLIENQGKLEAEFTKPFFYLHHLTGDRPTSSSSGYHYNSNYSPIPSFTLSRLNTCRDLINKSIEILDQKENLSKYSLNSEKRKYKVWVINNDNLINLNYQLNVDDFAKLNGKYLIKKELGDLLIKNTGLSINHLVIEEKISSKIKESGESYWPSNYYIHFPPTPSDGRIGLQNQGNTCYMNSALQCLVHIPELTQYFLFDCFQQELNTDNPLGMSGKVAMSFGGLIHALFDKSSDRKSAYLPRDFKSTIGHFNSMFADYHQQDSQEFLAFLLDGLHEDLNRIIKKPFTEKPELNEKNADENAIKELAEKSWAQHKLRNDSVIIDLFVGLYKSTLICPVCSKVSITFDPFSDLTLPLPTDSSWNFKLLLFLENGPIRSFEVELPKNSTYFTLKSYVSEKLNLNIDYLFATEIFNYQFYRNFENAESQSNYLPISDLIAEHDIIVMYEVAHEKNDMIVPVFNTILPPSSNIPTPFALPFFISLTESERKSFGAIRQKVEHRYEQLSTFQYFTKVRENQRDKKFTKKDFPLLHKTSNEVGKSKQDEVKNSEEEKDDGYDSEVSLANPDISGDYAFKIKLFDSSKEVRTRRKNYQFGRYNSNSGSNKSDSDFTKVWTPATNNNFTKLQDLLDFVDETKKAYYTYGKKLDIDNSNENSDISVETPDTGSDENKDTNVDDTIIPDQKITNIEQEREEEDPLIGNLLSDAEAENEHEEETPDVDMNLGSSTHLEQGPSPVDSSDIITVESKSDEFSSTTSKPTVEDLIKDRTALVCEWTPEFFDIFFSGLEDEGEGGNNTYTNPTVLVNEEVEASKKKKAEKKNDTLTLDQCLNLFSKPEVLGEHDLWYCSDCKEHRQASKQIEIWSTPDILSIHLKRFENQRSFSDKIDAVVEFPIENLDMSKHISKTITDNDDHIYDLFAVDNHYGGIGGGHYTSYVKNFIDNKWYYYDDSRVSPTTPEKAISGAAYLLFYRKRSAKFLGGERLSELIEKSREEFEERERNQLRLQQEFYETNREDSTEDEDNDVEELDSSEDNVSSIHVGTDDEEDLSSSRRKQRLLGRVKKQTLLNDSAAQSDFDSSAIGSPNSVASDDNLSTYSGSVNPPSNQLYSVNSPRP